MKKLPLPNPAILPRKLAAEYLGMSVDLFNRHVSNGTIEAPIPLSPYRQGWSIKQLERAVTRLEALSLTNNTEPASQFDHCLKAYNGSH